MVLRLAADIPIIMKRLSKVAGEVAGVFIGATPVLRI